MNQTQTQIPENDYSSKRPSSLAPGSPTAAAAGVTDAVKLRPAYLLVLIAFLSLVVAFGFFQHQGSLRAAMIDSTLTQISLLLQENDALVAKLEQELHSDPASGILESYLVEIRKTGVAKNARLKQLLDQLAQNNIAIVTLIKAYSPQGKTQHYKTEADKFRNYASAWQDRWNSVMELYMAGGNYAVAATPFPTGFAIAVRQEISAASE